MSKFNLKNFLNHRSDTAALLHALYPNIHASCAIRDDKGEVVFGTSSEQNRFIQPIQLNNTEIGSVETADESTSLGKLINHLVQKEAEKKKMGAEVLNLYQEINLIFNFSEKLAQTIDAPSICTATLQEARQVISSNHGVIILWDTTEEKLQVYASYGSSFFTEEIINQHQLFLLQIILGGQSEIVTDTKALEERQIVSSEVKSIIYSALKVNHRIMGALILGSTDAVIYSAADLKLLTTLALQSSAAVESALLFEKNIREAKDREEAMRLVYEVTGKFVPYEFIGSLGHKVLTDVKLGDQVQKIVTVLFSDIRDYTSLSEQMTPEENFRFICSFNERMGPAIRNHRGFINQYLGDAIMAIFPHSANDALLAAIAMMDELKKLNDLRAAEQMPLLHIGIGMHTGPLIMGITGDADRMDATTISDTVNTASRLENLTKHYRCRIMLSDSSVQQLQDTTSLRYLGIVQLKGKTEPIHIHEWIYEDSAKNQSQTRMYFNDGVKHFLNRNFEKALANFEQVIEMDPQDLTASFFVDKVRNTMQKGVPHNWTGAVEMTAK